ncbi:MAG: hypothetical protein JO128_10080 [Alphaproteobacteria bacterium]|nr:hypothetical protein [Alphaproteobacteria bacterium]
MHRTLATALLIGVTVTGALIQMPRAMAQEDGPRQITPSPDTGNPDADAFLRDTIGRLVDALGQVIETLPRYAPPEFDKDGNIILRRLNPPDRSPRPDLPPHGWTLDRTST